MIVDTDAYRRSALLEEQRFQPEQHCHRPIVIGDVAKRLGHIIQQFEVHVSHEGDDVVDRDVVLIWGDDKRIITGANILGRLLTGITKERVAWRIGTGWIRKPAEHSTKGSHVTHPVACGIEMNDSRLHATPRSVDPVEVDTTRYKTENQVSLRSGLKRGK